MLDERSALLIHVQFNLLHDCLRSICYFRHLAGIQNKPDGLIYTKDVFSENIIVTWCKLFGSNGEDTHWRNLAQAAETLPGLGKFGRQEIMAATGLSPEEWENYHSEMTAVRNKYFAHLDLESAQLNYPNLDPALSAALAYRSWLSLFVNTAIHQGFAALNVSRPNEAVMQQFESEAITTFGGRGI